MQPFKNLTQTVHQIGFKNNINKDMEQTQSPTFEHSNQQKQCLICLRTPTYSPTNSEPHNSPNNIQLIELDCHHMFCFACMREYLDTLQKYHILTPQKLKCLSDECSQELADKVITTVYPGEIGFVLQMVKKRYKQSKDPSMTIFNCKGLLQSNRRNLIEKSQSMSREQHSTLINRQVREQREKIQIKKSQSQSFDEATHLKQNDLKICTNILSFNKFSIKDKTVQCYVCGASYCPNCEDLAHEGSKCQLNEKEKDLQKYAKKGGDSQLPGSDDIEEFLEANQMIKCLNPKCQVAIAKEEGCYWVKCRCSWELCYPCRKLWGDCEHFAKYPYPKFKPPPEWMVKALGLY